MPNLHTLLVEKEEISDIDRDIRKYIENKTEINFDDFLKNDDRWEIFFHLSDMRKGLLNWYDFKREASLLEIGGQFGALTEIFAEKCREVTTIEPSRFKAETIDIRCREKKNIDIYVTKFEEFYIEKKFDYIVIVGFLGTIIDDSLKKNNYQKFFELVKTFLKKDGIILLAVDNRYGIRYFCGEADPYSRVPFSMLNSYYVGKKGYLFNRQELNKILEEANFNNLKFYYPLPDYILPQVIYSDRYLPKKNIRERLIPYYRTQNTLIANELDLYDDIIENDVFEFFANSFLVEAALNKTTKLCKAVYTTVTADRGPQNAFITTIYENKLVKKKLFYPKYNNILHLFDNMKDLQLHGINIVEHSLNNNELVMPYIEADTLSNYLKKIVLKDQVEFEKLIDQLYEIILRSSERTLLENNRFKRNDNELLNFQWGPILKKAYIEMIPLNCFFLNGQFIFFDQEFFLENCPAKYVLFRALKYCYLFDKNFEDIRPLQYFKSKYGFSEELWIFFENEENIFINEIRQQSVYQNFYKWTGVDPIHAHENAKKLLSESSVATQYEVSANMKAVWAVELDLLRVLKGICKKYNLRYYMIYGTLLGAVRHKGFIPWDDDVDIAMPREDFEILRRIATNELEWPYFLQTPENDLNCFYGGYFRLRNSNTTGINMIDLGRDGNNGIWIDILPLDNCVVDLSKRQKNLKDIKYIQRLIYAKVYGGKWKLFKNKIKNLQWYLYRLCAIFYSHSQLCEKFQNALLKYTQEDSPYFAIFTHANVKYRIFEKDDFKESVWLNFEGIQLPAPVNYKHCLEMSMGKDYMQYPPRNERKPHHLGIFNAKRSYKEYHMKFIDIFPKNNDKIIVLFGAGIMFEDYMNLHGKKYKPVFLVDNNMNKWGQKKLGIMIKKPKDILAISDKKLHLIICSIYYQEIELQLKEMGIKEYHIYLDKKHDVENKI